MAIGNYDELPFTRAEGRISVAGKEIVYSFDDPRLDFGRVVVRSDQPLSVLRRELFVGFNGSGLLVSTRGGGRGGAGRISQLEIWLRISGALRGGRSYEWEIEGGGSQEVRGGVPAVIPMLWADGEQIAAEVTIADPEPEDTDRIQRLLFPHGVVELPPFTHQSGAAWVVLRPSNFGEAIAVRSFSFREVEKDLGSEGPSSMPIPVRYIPIRSIVEDQVAEVFDRSVEVLRGMQNPDGFWGAQGGGEPAIQSTSVVANALAGIDPNWEGLKKAYDWLAAAAPPQGQNWAVVTVAARLGCLAGSPQPADYSSVIRRDVVFLTDAQLADGGWGERSAAESATARGAVQSIHTTTFTVMASLANARLAGVDPDAKVWRNAIQYWTDAQSYGGAFADRLTRYGGVGQISAGNTGWGTAGLTLGIDMAFAMGGRNCTAYTAASRQLRAVEAGLAWLDENYGREFRSIQILGVPTDPRFEWNGLLAAGQITGRVHFNEKDHFRESASALLAHFDQGTAMFGIRDGQGNFATPPNPDLTANALGFLVAGSAPTVCQRIIAGDDERGLAVFRRDASHLAAYLGRNRSQPFQWRQTSIDREIRELAEVPILILSVVGKFEWPEESWAKLRTYCLAGGSIVVDIDPGAEDQRESVLSGISRAFPDYSLEDLPPTSAILAGGNEPLKVPGLKAMGNGFRHFLFIPKESWSCQWHLYNTKEHRESFAFMDRLLTYATDGSPPRSSFAGSTYALPAASSKRMSAAQLQVGGDVPAYPNLIETMNRLMQSNYRVEVAESDRDADLLWVNVAGDASPEGKSAERIVEALSKGKFVLIDVISGNEDWDENFQAALRKLDSKVSLERLSRTDPVFTGRIPGSQGFHAETVRFRKALHSRFATSGRCDLYSILWEGKPVGVYSAHDLASGIGYNYFPGCRGPNPSDARRIAINAFLSAYARKVDAATVQ